MKVIQIPCPECLGTGCSRDTPICRKCGGYGVDDKIIEQDEEQYNYDKQLDEHIKNKSWEKPE